MLPFHTLHLPRAVPKMGFTNNIVYASFFFLSQLYVQYTLHFTTVTIPFLRSGPIIKGEKLRFRRAKRAQTPHIRVSGCTCSKLQSCVFHEVRPRRRGLDPKHRWVYYHVPWKIKIAIISIHATVDSCLINGTHPLSFTLQVQHSVLTVVARGKQTYFQQKLFFGINNYISYIYLT